MASYTLDELKESTGHTLEEVGGKPPEPGFATKVIGWLNSRITLPPELQAQVEKKNMNKVSIAATLADIPTTSLAAIGRYFTHLYAGEKAAALDPSSTFKQQNQIAREFSKDVVPPLDIFTQAARRLYPTLPEENVATAAMDVLSTVIGKGARGLEKFTGLPSELTESTIEGLMGVGGVKLSVMGVKGIAKMPGEARARTAAREQVEGARRDAIVRDEEIISNVPKDRAASLERQVESEDFARTAPEPEPAWKAAERELQGGYTLDEVMAAPEKAAPPATPARLIEQNTETLRRMRADRAIEAHKEKIGLVAEEASPKPVVRQYADIEEVPPKPKVRQYADVEESPISPVLDSALTKISGGGRGLLSAEERIALQSIAEASGIVDASGKPIRSKQGGFISPEIGKEIVSVLSYAVGSGAAAAWVVTKVYNHYHPDDQKTIGELFGPLFKAKEAGPDISLPENRIDGSPSNAIVPESVPYMPFAGQPDVNFNQETLAPGGSVWAAAPVFAAGMLRGKPSGMLSKLRDSGPVRAADYVAGLVSTRVRNISPEVLRSWRANAMNTLDGEHRAFLKTDPFFETVGKLPSEVRTKLNSALVANNESMIKGILREVPGGTASWAGVRSVLDDLGGKLKEGGYLGGLREDYFPRIVRDPEGLMAALDKPLRSSLEEKLNQASIKAHRPLTEIEESAIINRELRAQEATQGRKSFQMKRGVDDTTGLEQFYYPPADSLHSYIRGAVGEIEKAKFFGKDLVKESRGGVEYIDIDQSIGNLVRGELNAGKIGRSEMIDLSKMLHSYFDSAKPTMGIVQDWKNLTNAALLGNVVSAATQLGDALMVPFHADLRGTLSATAQAAAGKRRITVKDYGLADHLSEEFTSTRSTAKVLNGVLKWSGFNLVDSFGKNTMLNATLERGERLAQNLAGQKKLVAELEKMGFTKDAPSLLADLKLKNTSPLVREYLFNKLSDIQPITKLEVPQAYLDSPNARVLYQLKTFMLKQADIARVKGFGEIADGNVGTGMKNLLAYGTLLGISGATTQMIQDWMLGRPMKEPGWQDVALNTLKTFGWSSYVMDQVKQKGVLSGASNIVAPPFKVFDDLVEMDPKAINYLPLIGRLLYPHTDSGQLSESRREKKQREERDPMIQLKQEVARDLRKRRLEDPAWRQYYLDKAKGLSPARP